VEAVGSQSIASENKYFVAYDILNLSSVAECKDAADLAIAA